MLYASIYGGFHNQTLKLHIHGISSVLVDQMLITSVVSPTTNSTSPPILQIVHSIA